MIPGDTREPVPFGTVSPTTVSVREYGDKNVRPLYYLTRDVASSAAAGLDFGAVSTPILLGCQELSKAYGAEALFERTSQLRRVELVPPKTAIGRNTAASIQSGIIFGHVGMVEAMVHRFKAEIGEDTRVVATGGMAPLIQKETSIFDAVNLDLTLVGLRLIYELNADAKNVQGEEEND